MSKIITPLKLKQMKESQKSIVMVTAYDYTSARLIDETDIELVLVGDSLNMVMLGQPNTLSVTMDEMLHHTKAVKRGISRSMVIGDMPFLSYQVSPEAALVNAGRFVQEAGAYGVKLEGGSPVAQTIRQIVNAGIPVMGHLGFTPQAVNQLGGAFFQGKTAEQGTRLLEEALRLEDAGVFALVLELVPLEVAAVITKRLQIPVIGIGSGASCDGQVLVFHDLLGLNRDFQPKHNKVFADVGAVIKDGLHNYVSEVREGHFPTIDHTKRMATVEYQNFLQQLEQIKG